MPALPPVPKVLRFDHNMTVGEDLHAKSRFFIQYSGTAPTNSDLAALGSALTTSWNSRMKPLQSTAQELDSVDITDLSSPTAATRHALVALEGTRSGTPLPADIAALYSMAVHRRYRGGHPRIYWPLGVVADLADQQKWSAAAVTAFEAGIGNYIQDIIDDAWSGAGTMTLVSPSYYEGFTVHTGVTGRARNVSTPRTTPLVDAIVSAAVQVGLASIRKRLLRLA